MCSVYGYTRNFLIISAAAAAKSLQLCPTLCDPIDGSPPGSPIPGILQARTLSGVQICTSSDSPEANETHSELLVHPWRSWNSGESPRGMCFESISGDSNQSWTPPPYHSNKISRLINHVIVLKNVIFLAGEFFFPSFRLEEYLINQWARSGNAQGSIV